VRLLLIGLSSLVLVSCATSPSILKQSMLIEPGMSKAEVVDILGAPRNRSFRDNVEVLQFCRTGNLADEYVNVWLLNGTVKALTNYKDTSGFLCGDEMREVDWGQAPPDIRIALEHSLK
jgi:hypothetical protein